MKENCDEKVKESWLLKNCNLIVILEGDSGVHEHDIAKSFDQIPCHLASYMLGHTKRLMN